MDTFLFQIFSIIMRTFFLGKYGQRVHDQAKKATYAFENTSKKVVQKTTEATGDLIRHKMTNKTVGKSKDSIISDPLEFWKKSIETLTQRYLPPEQKLNKL